MLKQTCLVLFVILFYKSVTSSKNDLSNRLYKSLERVLDYVYENLQEMNVDGLFGMVFVQAHLQGLIECRSSLLDKRALIYQKNKVVKILKETKLKKIPLNANHKIFIKYLLDSNIWKKNITFTSGYLDNNTEMYYLKFNEKTCREYNKYLKMNYFSENISDQCLIELIKSSIMRPHNCQITDFCSKYMVEGNDHVPAYGTTHRLLYLQISEARKCNWNKEWLKMRMKEYCSHILWEARTNSGCGFIPEWDDLFLEQIFLCGYQGFTEFFPKNWMEYVLSIQTQYGCFGSSHNMYYYEDFEKRRKREANVIKFGCVDHTTGLAAGVLSLFLRNVVQC